MLTKAEAFVLRKYDFTESSFIVHFFTREAGAIKLVAKGAKRQKSPFRGNIETMNLVEIEFVKKEGSDLGTLRQAELVSSAFSLFSDTESSKAAFAISEILCRAMVEGQAEEEIFRLVRASVSAMKEKAPPRWVFNYFLYWLLKLEGVLSSPGLCGKCGSADIPRAFQKEEGGWLCPKCHKEGGFVLGAESVDLIKEVFSKPPAGLSQKKGQTFPKELETMLYFNIYHLLGSDINTLRIGM
ncbi:MAG TPA: DNA repair protein RecO [Acidobacteriota bacterium]|nr:DNA repair protein RecO [Acidobacteriota bacterium]HQO20224.1 DNA repair protein RecO [Acidobacteriota bacterium]HQQ46933.1 DNA repair protein RecO [Acidobacteriota bacterium]